jgi:hypothetical protein
MAAAIIAAETTPIKAKSILLSMPVLVAIRFGSLQSVFSVLGKTSILGRGRCGSLGKT